MNDYQANKATRATGMLALASLALMLCAYAPQSQAACTLGEGIDQNVITIDLGNVLVPPKTAASLTSPIATRRFPIRHKGDLKLDCRKSSTDGALAGSIHRGTQVPSSTQIYRTNIPGIGIRIGFREWERNGTMYFPYTDRVGHGSYMTSTSPNWVIHVEVFKIEKNTGNGALAEGLYATWYSIDEPQKALQVVVSGRATSIVTPSCTAEANTTTVELGKVWKNLFSSVGSTAAEKSFNIKLNCREAKPELHSVYLRMDANTAPSGAPGVLALTPGANAATGVGIQILDKDRQPVVYGQGALVGVSKDGVYNVPFHARYYQTENKVTAGVANGTATFTLEYK